MCHLKPQRTFIVNFNKTPLGGVPFQAESIEQNTAKMFLIKANNFNLILCMLFFHAFVVICYFSNLTFSIYSGKTVWCNFSDSEYPCHPDAFQQVLVPFDICFGR